MPAKRSFVPKYCLHKPSGFAYVRISGKVIYLGEYDSPGSKEEYGRLITEFATNPTATTKVAASITVVELADAYWQYAEGYYVKQGKPTSGLNNVRLAFVYYGSCMPQVQPINLARWLLRLSGNPCSTRAE